MVAVAPSSILKRNVCSNGGGGSDSRRQVTVRGWSSGWLLVLRAVVDERVGGAGGHGGLLGPALSTMVDADPALRAGAPPLRRRCGPGARATRRLAYGLWVNQSLPPGGGCGLPPRALRLGRSRSGLAFAARASGAQWGGVHRRTGQRPAQPILPTTGPSPSSSGTATPSAHASCQLSCLSWEEVDHAPWYFPVSVPGLGTALGPCLGGQGVGVRVWLEPPRGPGVGLVAVVQTGTRALRNGSAREGLRLRMAGR